MHKKSVLAGRSFTGLDDLFTNDFIKTESSDKVVMLPLNQLNDFHNHPFKVQDDEKMAETVESIRNNGVLVPVIVRKKGHQYYELISGHRRKRACEILGLTEIPAIIRELNDDEATIIMVDANLQREQIDYSEKAFAFKMKLEALKHQGCKGIGDTADEIGEEAGESGRQIRRYIRLTELIPELLSMVDRKKIGLVPAVDLSYLSKENQKILAGKILSLNAYPSLNQARQLKEYEQRGELTSACIDNILNQCPKIEKTISFELNKFEKYFPTGTTKDEMEKIIVALLQKWNE